MVHALNVFAAEAIKGRDLWYPTILGVLVVVAAVALFMGTIYILLATNMGARLGFLVATGGLAGLMVLLSFLWLTNPSPVNTLKGRIPAYKAVEAIQNGDVARSKIPQVQQINDRGHQVNQQDLANVKAAVDTNLIINKDLLTGENLAGANGTYAIYVDATKYIVTKNQETGGGEIFSQFKVDTGGGFPWIHVSLHTPKYVVVTLCDTDPALSATEVPFGQRPPVPKCANKQRQILVLERDLGSLRVPPLVVFIASSILLGLILLAMHWRERDMQEAAARLAGEAEAITKAAADRDVETV
ncbi:MAG: hypothetical protein ABJC79_17215 [Acidimicrobiia bacterium]